MEANATTLYYTFSTIAQALAALVAILAAFAVMRLSDLSRRLEEQLQPLARLVQYPEIFYANLASGDFADAMAQIPDDALGGGDDQLVMMVSSRAEDERRSIISALRFCYGFSGAVILFAVVSLIFAESISSNSTSTAAALTVGFIGLVLSLLVVVRLINRLAPGHLPRRRARKGIKKGKKA